MLLKQKTLLFCLINTPRVLLLKKKKFIFFYNRLHFFNLSFKKYNFLKTSLFYFINLSYFFFSSNYNFLYNTTVISFLNFYNKYDYFFNFFQFNIFNIPFFQGVFRSFQLNEQIIDSTVSLFFKLGCSKNFFLKKIFFEDVLLKSMSV